MHERVSKMRQERKKNECGKGGVVVLWGMQKIKQRGIGP